jgi:hypothetical protein
MGHLEIVAQVSNLRFCLQASQRLGPRRSRPRRDYNNSLANRAVLGQNKSIMKRSSLLIAFILAFVCSDLFAQTKIELQSSDTILSTLQKNAGQTVELRMTSGEKIGGKVERVGDKLVHLSKLTGAEYYDALVDTSDVAAVVVRTSK